MISGSWLRNDCWLTGRMIRAQATMAMPRRWRVAAIVSTLTIPIRAFMRHFMAPNPSVSLLRLGMGSLRLRSQAPQPTTVRSSKCVAEASSRS
jgi:hypothetical protein